MSATPLHICAHYWPGLVRGCAAGRAAPFECAPSCQGYADGREALTNSHHDRTREMTWSLVTGRQRAPGELTSR